MDDYLPTALIIVLSLNAVLILGQAAITDVSDEVGSSQLFYNASGSLICNHEKGKCSSTTYEIDNTDPSGYLPSSETIESGDGSIFTDTFASIKRFFTDTLGLGYITEILNAPYTFISLLGLPNLATFTLAAIWYIFTFLVIVAFFWGR